MARQYNGYTTQTNTASTTAPMFNIVSAATIKPKVYEFNSGSDAAPADNAAKFSFRRTTANFGTPSAVTPNPLDPNDPASLALFSAPGGTAPTITASSDLYQWAQNSRATYRWIAAPGSELVLPATASNGMALMAVVTTSAVSFAWTVLWAE